MELKFLPPREFQADSVAVVGDVAHDSAAIVVTPLRSTARRQVTVLGGHLTVTDDSGARSGYDIRIRVADGLPLLRAVSGKAALPRPRPPASGEGAKP